MGSRADNQPEKGGTTGLRTRKDREKMEEWKKREEMDGSKVSVHLTWQEAREEGRIEVLNPSETLGDCQIPNLPLINFFIS